MTEDLTRRFVARQLQMTTAELVLAAERLATDARQYAGDVAAGRHGSAHRLAQDAAAVALIERRLAGMREISDLLPVEGPVT